MLKAFCDSYFADAVVSFGIKAVIPAQVCGPLGAFVGKWVTTSLPLMTIIGQTMTTSYVEECSPVFSSRSFDFYHFTLIKKSALVVGGEQVVCINKCGTPLSTSSRKLGGMRYKWRIECSRCSFNTAYFFPDDAAIVYRGEDGVDRKKDGIEAVPGAEYLRTRFPIPVKNLAWVKPKVRTQQPSSSSTSVVRTSSAPPPRLTTTTALLRPQEVQKPKPANSRSNPSTPPPSASSDDSADPSATAPSVPVGPRSPTVTRQDPSSKEVLLGPAPLDFAPLGPWLPRRTSPVRSSKRDRGGSLAVETPSDMEEGSSKTVRRKKSRNCACLAFRLVKIS